MAIYEPKLVEQYLNEVLKTLLPVEAFAEIDDSLKSNPGDTVEIWRYHDTGAAEHVAYGEGNVGYSDIDGESYEYKVGVVQARVKLYDEDIQKNPTVANMKMGIAPKHIVNAIREDVVKQWYNTDNVYPVASATGLPTIAELIMAQASIDLGVDNGLNGTVERLCFFLAPRDFRSFQAYLAGENVIVESKIIDGKTYSVVAGIPFSVSDLVLEGSPVLATNKAVRVLHSSCKDTEAERDANVRLSTYYSRDNYAAALEFIKKAIVFGETLAITKTAPSNGTFEVPSELVKNSTLYIRNIQPAVGYELNQITVTDSDGEVLPVDLEHNTVRLGDKPVTVEVTFNAI